MSCSMARHDGASSSAMVRHVQTAIVQINNPNKQLEQELDNQFGGENADALLLKA